MPVANDILHDGSHGEVPKSGPFGTPNTECPVTIPVVFGGDTRGSRRSRILLFCEK